MRSVCYAKATYYGMGFPPNFGGVTIFLFAALAPWPVFLQKAVGKIEYVATVDLINSCNIDRISKLLLHLALYKIISLSISEIAI